MKRKTVLFYLPYFFQFSCINHNFSGEALKNATTVYMSPEVNIKLQKGVNSRQFEMFTTNLGRLLLMTSLDEIRLASIPTEKYCNRECHGRHRYV